MKQGQIWSDQFDCYVSRTFAPETQQSSAFKIDITKCEIIITPEGFYNLQLNGKKIKRIAFNEYMKYRKSVSRILNYCKGGEY